MVNLVFLLYNALKGGRKLWSENDVWDHEGQRDKCR